MGSLLSAMTVRSKSLLLTFCCVTFLVADRARAADWLGGTSNWSDDFFWSTGFIPGPGEDVWINAPGGSEINFDVATAKVRELRLGNGEDNQVFNIPAGTLTITADNGDSDPSWSGRWSSNTTTTISGTGKIEVTNVGQEDTPYYIAGNQGPGGGQNFLQDAMFIVEGNGQFVVSDGGAPVDEDGNATAGSVNVAQWREARATTIVRDNGLIDISGDFRSNSGGWTLTQEGGQIDVGVSFYLDRFDAIDGQGAAAEGTGLISGGQMNVGWNFHVVQNGKGEFTVTDQGKLDIDNVLKVNDVFAAATEADGDGTLNITENGLVTTRFLEVPTAAQLLNDTAALNITGGLLVIEDSAVEADVDPLGGQVQNVISDDVAAWINSGFLAGSLGTVNRTPDVNIPVVSSLGDVAWGRASEADGGALYIWTEEILGLAGDFDGNGMVTASDFAVWRASVGSPTEDVLSGNGNGSGGVEIGDYELWGSQFGSPSAAAVSAAAVPEPCASIAILLAWSCGQVSGRRRSFVLGS